MSYNRAGSRTLHPRVRILAMHAPHGLPQIVIGRHRHRATVQNYKVRLTPIVSRIHPPLAQ